MGSIDASRKIEILADKLEKPELDNRSYRVIRLPNQLEALLVHDPDTDKASASVNVGVGSFSDDDDMPGMAHAVEHLLFMGTKKYPVENDYNQYLSAHSGYSNAYTASTETNYYFEIAASSEDAGNSTSASSVATPNGSSEVLPEANVTTVPLTEIKSNESPLYGALDRFSQFFIAPLFLEATLDRELRAVDSENKKNLQSDNWRLMQLDKSLSTKKHPYHHFSTGNLSTLRDEPRKRGVEIRSEFMKFHATHYSANKMKLVVLGKEPLDTLQAWVEELFSEVENKNLPPLRWTESGPYDEQDLLKIIYAKPVMDSRNLDITFTYRDEEAGDFFHSQPSRYITHLIGHEGPGSILAYLKAKGWANSLSVGTNTVSPDYAMLHINSRLTVEGLQHYEEIVKIIFQYIAMIKLTPPQQWVFEELKNMSQVDFRFMEKSPATRFTSNTSSTMQKGLPRELLLSGERVVRKYDAIEIEKGLSWLTPYNYRLAITSQEFPGDWDQKEKWYGTEYRVQDIPAELQKTLADALKSKPEEIPKELHLPAKNEFVPTQLTVERKEVQEPAKAPKLLRNDEAVRLWWKKDDHFWVPKASFKALFRNPIVNITAENSVKTALYTMLVHDELNEYGYDAEIAGLDWGLTESNRGLSIHIGGYNEKMPVLLEKILICMKNIDIKEDRFQIIKERMLRGYRNWEFSQPYQHAGAYQLILRAATSWTNEQMLAEIEHVTRQDVVDFYPQLLKRVFTEIIAHGNLYKEDALRMAKLIETHLQPRALPRGQCPLRRDLVLPEGSDFTFSRVHKDPKMVNNAIDLFLYCGALNDPVLRAKVLLLGQIGNEPAFDNLRTKEQLGYIVWSGARYCSTTLGYRVTIQSERSPEYLEKRINAFLMTLYNHLQEMPQKDFDAHKRSLINQRLEKLKNLDSEFGRFYGHISDGYFNFLQADEDAENVRSLNRPDMLAFFEQFLHPASPHRAKLSVHIIAQGSTKEAGATLSNEEQLEKIYSNIEKSLTASGVGVNSERLQARLADVDILGGDQNGIVTAMLKYLEEDAQLPEDQLSVIAEQAPKLLSTVLPGLGIEVQKADEKSLPPAPEVKETIWVENIADWKATLQATAAPVPVVDLSTFEELEPKL